MRAEGDAAARVHMYERTVWKLVVLAYIFGYALAMLYAILFIETHSDDSEHVVRGIAHFAPLLGLALVTGSLQIRHRTTVAMQWMVEDRPPRDDERAALFSLPPRTATIGAAYWVLLTAISLPYSLAVLDLSAGAVLRGALGAVPLVLIPWSLSFLLVERMLGPIYADSVTEGAPLPKTMGIPSRLILAWGATSGLPILGIVLNLFGQDAAQRARVVPMVFAICGAGTAAGIAVAVFSGWAITAPLTKVRTALRRIEKGDLDVQLPVSESAELGELQVGVNRMVAGLRERDRIRAVFGQHVGPEVARRAMEREAMLGGELVEATGMFVDMIGSSTMAEERSPQEVVEVLNVFFDTVVRCVGAEGGYVNRFEGDGAICIFGAPVPTKDHADRALRAARALRTELRALAEDVDAGIGISSGHHVAGNIGSADRYEYTIIGDAVNEASRLSDEAKEHPARVLASEHTLDRAGAEAKHWNYSETVALRGRARPTVVFVPSDD